MPLMQTYTRAHPHRRTGIVAAMVAISVAMASLSPTPAYADRNDTLRTVATIAGILIVGKIIADERKKRRQQQARVTRRPPVIGSTLPLQCVRWVDSDRGAYRILGKRCIERRIGHVELPRSCERRFWGSDGRSKTGYDRNCLLDYGYRIEPVSSW